MAYEVLIRVSPGYPSVKGRLHTRYAPVRRSQVSLLLPLDLHVLSLPLAFILSQDQTLRCNQKVKFPITQVPLLELTKFVSPCSFVLHYLKNSFSLFPPVTPDSHRTYKLPKSPSLSFPLLYLWGRKVNHLFLTSKIF
jgi:hypothetical protein